MSHLKAKLGKKFNCSICGNVYEDENRKIGLFLVPKNMFSRWKSIIPELKKQLECAVLILKNQI